MDTAHLVFLFLAIGLIAFLYSSVGHAGASGYIATMTLFGLAPAVIRPTALVLNILACRLFLLEIILAICVAFHSGRICGRLFAAVRSGSENLDRHCAGFLRRATSLSAD